MERAELDELRVQFDSLPPVTVLQDASIGIPGAVYDCSIALAAHLVDEVLPEAWHEHAAASRRAGPKILELGCGVGACGALVLAAAAARGVPLDVTLTDRNPRALRLAASTSTPRSATPPPATVHLPPRRVPPQSPPSISRTTPSPSSALARARTSSCARTCCTRPNPPRRSRARSPRSSAAPNPARVRTRPAANPSSIPRRTRAPPRVTSRGDRDRETRTKHPR